MDNSKAFQDKLVPLSKVVNSALLTGYQDAGKSKELYTHFAGRAAKKLQTETFHIGKQRALLTVNHSTKTATLPIAFDEEVFVGYIENGQRVSLRRNTNLINEATTEEITCEDSCPKCQQDKGICNDLETTETEEVVIVNGTTVTKTVIKKLYPNGDYFLETTTPYYNTVTETVEYATTKEFIVALSLKSCGCLDTSDENLRKVQSCSPDVYNCYFSSYCGTCDTDLGGYRILPESGLIQLDYRFDKDQLYIEFNTTLPRIRGQYVVPSYSFETMVKLINFMAVEGNRSVPLQEREWRFNHYRIERGNMEKVMGRVSLANIIKIVNSVPKFDWELKNDFPTTCRATSNPYISEITSSNVCETAAVSCPTNSIGQKLTPFQLAVKVGLGSQAPIEGEFTYQNDGLIGALNLETILVGKNDETQIDGDFTFDPVTGTITRVNPWNDGDSLIAGFAKLV